MTELQSLVWHWQNYLVRYLFISGGCFTALVQLHFLRVTDPKEMILGRHWKPSLSFEILCFYDGILSYCKDLGAFTIILLYLPTPPPPNKKDFFQTRSVFVKINLHSLDVVISLDNLVMELLLFFSSVSSPPTGSIGKHAGLCRGSVLVLHWWTDRKKKHHRLRCQVRLWTTPLHLAPSLDPFL